MKSRTPRSTTTSPPQDSPPTFTITRRRKNAYLLAVNNTPINPPITRNLAELSSIILSRCKLAVTTHSTQRVYTLIQRALRTTNPIVITETEFTSHLLKAIISPTSADWVERYMVQSSSNPNLLYTVAKNAIGSWGCSCPAWTFQRIICKHIRAVQERPSLYPHQGHP